MNGNDVESTGIDRYLRVRGTGDAVVESFPPAPPLCPECIQPVVEPHLIVLKSKRYPTAAHVHWDCYNNEEI